jgi:ATP-dependent DNA helicase RecG
MNRLLQGDVGSGKTVVAGLAMRYGNCRYAGCNNGSDRNLAEQHYETLSSLFPECKISLLTGSMKVGEKREALEHIASGEVHMIVGHML